MEMLYEDNDLLVCVKPVGILSQPDPSGSEDMLTLLQTYYNSRNENTAIYPVHRLDRAVGGVMVFARKSAVAARLSESIRNRDFVKEYWAAVHGCPEEKSGVFKDLLFKDSSKNKSFVVTRQRKGVKEASLEYEMLDARKDTSLGQLSLVKIRLHTGRTHQIRVQFSSRKMPLAGDGKYGGRDNGCDIALWSYRLAFQHPTQKQTVDVCCLPPDSFPWNAFDIHR